MKALDPDLASCDFMGSSQICHCSSLILGLPSWKTRGPASWEAGLLKGAVSVVLRVLTGERGRRAGSADPPPLHGCLKQAQRQTLCVCVCVGDRVPGVEELVSAITGAAQTHSDRFHAQRWPSSLGPGDRSHQCQMMSQPEQFPPSPS